MLLVGIGVYAGITIKYNIDLNKQPAVQSQVTQPKDNAVEEAKRKEVELTVENLVKFTNQERVKAGLQPVVNNPLLNQSAQAKADDMVSRNYWSHNAPDGTEPWQFIHNVDYNYDMAGENLSCWYDNAKQAVDAWMDSPTHKANILMPEFTEVGFGIILKTSDYVCGDKQPGNYSIVVQHFAQPK